MKKSIALILALVLCLGIFAGCNADQPVETNPPATNPPATSGNTGDTTPATDPVEEEYTFPAGAEIEIVCAHDINDLPLDKFVEEATGLSVKWTPLSPYLDEMNTTLTQKVTASLYCYPDDGSWAKEMGRYGAFVNLWDYKEIMPNFFARMDAYEGTYEDYMMSEDELYAAPVFLNGDVQHYAFYYREDVFEELNIKVPTTWDEFLAACKALKEAYPDCYPFTMRSGVWGFGQMMHMFGVEYAFPALDRATGKYYNAATTDYARDFLKAIRELIELGYMDVAALSNGTADWVADLSSSKSFMTHDKAFQMTNLEKAGQEADPDFSLSWFHNFPVADSDLPYQCCATKDYMYSWQISTKCPDIELACRYLDWMYSDEGSLILSWGKQGESYDIDENGNKYFIEGYDKTFQARYQESGFIDMKATAATYSAKTQEMIFDTMAVAAEGQFWAAPSLNFTSEEQNVVTTYQVDWQAHCEGYWQKFLLGELDIDDDAVWAQFVAECAGYGEADILAAYDSAYARYVSG